MFEALLPHVLREEGGFVNDPADSGGATNKGVTQSTYDSFRQRKGFDVRSVVNLSNAEAKEIYTEFWENCKAHELPAGVNLMHFDFAVNAGIRRAAITLQKCVAVTEDGIIGPATLKAAREKDAEKLIADYANERRAFYNRLAERRPKDKRFLRGWLNRTARMEKRSIDAYRQFIADSGPDTV